MHAYMWLYVCIIVQCLGAGVIGSSCEQLNSRWEPNLGILEDYYILLTTDMSLQPHYFLFYSYWWYGGLTFMFHTCFVLVLWWLITNVNWQGLASSWKHSVVALRLFLEIFSWTRKVDWMLVEPSSLVSELKRRNWVEHSSHFLFSDCRHNMTCWLIPLTLCFPCQGGLYLQIVSPNKPFLP